MLVSLWLILGWVISRLVRGLWDGCESMSVRECVGIGMGDIEVGGDGMGVSVGVRVGAGIGMGDFGMGIICERMVWIGIRTGMVDSRMGVLWKVPRRWYR